MCGNQASTAIAPINNGIRDTIYSQLNTGKIALKNQIIRLPDAETFVRANTFNIKQLELENCKINHETLQVILRGNWINLSRLSLNKNQIGIIGCRHIAGAQSLTKLTVLELNSNKIKDMGLMELTAGPYLRLNDLSVSDNSITKSGIQKLSTFQQLQCLNLGGNKLNDESIETIKKLNAQKMLYLKLSRNMITDNGLRSLVCSKDSPPNLQVVMIDRNKIKGKAEQFKSQKSLFLFY